MVNINGLHKSVFTKPQNEQDEEIKIPADTEPSSSDIITPAVDVRS